MSIVDLFYLQVKNAIQCDFKPHNYIAGVMEQSVLDNYLEVPHHLLSVSPNLRRQGFAKSMFNWFEKTNGEIKQQISPLVSQSLFWHEMGFVPNKIHARPQDGEIALQEEFCLKIDKDQQKLVILLLEYLSKNNVEKIPFAIEFERDNLRKEELKNQQTKLTEQQKIVLENINKSMKKIYGLDVPPYINTDEIFKEMYKFKGFLSKFFQQ